MDLARVPAAQLGRTVTAFTNWSAAFTTRTLERIRRIIDDPDPGATIFGDPPPTPNPDTMWVNYYFGL